MTPLPLCSCTAPVAAALLCWLVLGCAFAGDESHSLFSPLGYRVTEFRAPVPESVPGGVTVHTEEVRGLVAAGEAVLVDVLPTPPRPEGLAPGALWLPPAHRNIPGSAWLPNVGFGELSEELDAYFRRQLERLTAGDPAQPILIYCQDDCWMSWNAARRAAAYGYTRVYWYPEGTSGWEAAGLALEKSRPIPVGQP